MPKHEIGAEDPNPPLHDKRNPLQVEHTPEEAWAVGVHLKLGLEHVRQNVGDRWHIHWIYYHSS